MKKFVGAAVAVVVVGMTGVTTWAVAAEQEPAPVRLVVGLKPGADRSAPARTMSAFRGTRWTAASGTGRAQLDLLGAQTAEVPAKQSKQAIAALRNDPDVAYVEVEQEVRAFDVTPDDELYVSGQQPEFAEVAVPAAWETTTGSAVTVAVVDTGVTATGDLSGAVLPGYDYVNGDSNAADDAGHGTMVASLIAARGNDGAGMAGVCWSCRILPVKVLDRYGRGQPSDIAKGIVYAVQNGAKVINLSLGGAARSTVMADAVAYANLKGVLVVAAAGNSGGTTAQTTPMYPAAYPETLSVAATHPGSDAPAAFTSRNAIGAGWVDVAAPGVVTTMDHHGRYAVAEGTSFSAPIVAGAAALVKSQNPAYTGYSLLRSIAYSARSIGSWALWGKIDAAAAFAVPTDRTAPRITGTSPASGAKVRGTVTVKPTGIADTGGSGVRNVDLYVDGKYVTQDRTAPYELKYNASKRNGTVKLTVYVYDRAGNRSSYARSIVADNTAPTVKITSAPKNKAKVKGKVKIGVSASDTYGVNRVELLMNGKLIQTDKTSGYLFTITASKQPKKMKVQIRAYDHAGNVRYATTRNWTR